MTEEEKKSPEKGEAPSAKEVAREEAPKTEAQKEKAPEEKKETPAKGEGPPPAAGVGKPKAERPKNCSQCNKPIKRKSWYYRNGKYFCGKGCWKLFEEKAVRGKAAQPVTEEKPSP